MTSQHKNRATFDRFVEFINTSDESMADEVIAEDAAFYAPGSDVPLNGPEGWLRVLRPMRAAFPDIRWEVLETVSEDATIVARFRVTATHLGDFMGIAPTGKAVTFGATNFYRFSHGKIISELGQPDLLSLFTQLGADPLGPTFSV